MAELFITPGERDSLSHLPKGGEPLTVWFADGLYTGLPLTFGENFPENVTFRAAPGAHPVISGGFDVRFDGETVCNSCRVFYADLGPGRELNVLYGEERLPRARFPREGWLTVSTADETPAMKHDGVPAPAQNSFTVDPAALPDMREADSFFIRLLHLWNDESFRVASYDPTEGRITTNRPSSLRLRTGERF